MTYKNGLVLQQFRCLFTKFFKVKGTNTPPILPNSLFLTTHIAITVFFVSY